MLKEMRTEAETAAKALVCLSAVICRALWSVVPQAEDAQKPGQMTMDELPVDPTTGEVVENE